MRKNVIYARSGGKNRMELYYRGKDEECYLFSRRFNRLVFQYFRDGKSVEQLHREKDWHRHPMLARVVESSLPAAIRRMEKGDWYA